MPQFYDSNISDKPNYNVDKIINKFMISINVKIKETLSVYYIWETERLMRLANKRHFKPYIIVDYNKEQREWHIDYIQTPDNNYHGTINDITGQVYLTKQE